MKINEERIRFFLKKFLIEEDEQLKLDFPLPPIVQNVVNIIREDGFDVAMENFGTIKRMINFFKKHEELPTFVDLIVEISENGNIGDVVKQFDSPSDFIELMEKYQALDKIDVIDDSLDVFQIDILKRITITPEIWKDIYRVLDIEQKDDKLIYFSDSEDVSSLFHEDIERTVKSMLEGDLDLWNWDLRLGNTGYEIYQDLTKENQNIVKNEIIDNHSDELGLKKEDNETDEDFKLRVNDYVDENIEDLLSEISYDGYDTLSKRLSNAADDAYRGAYESELYKNMSNKLSTYFSSYENKYNEKTKKAYLELDVTNTADSEILSYITNADKYYGSLTSIGDYIYLIKEQDDKLLYFNPEIYPNWDDELNKYFTDYFFQ
jgi:hypothetical protein